jgi:hypothetical protein
MGHGVNMSLPAAWEPRYPAKPFIDSLTHPYIHPFRNSSIQARHCSYNKPSGHLSPSPVSHKCPAHRCVLFGLVRILKLDFIQKYGCLFFPCGARD